MFEKLKKLGSSKVVKRVGAALMAMLCMVPMGVVAFAADPATPYADTADGMVNAAKDLFGNVTDVINMTTIAKVLGIGISACVLLFLGWWGIRKLIGVIRKALNGRLSV